jgi:subtilisin family serine protease
MDKRLTLFWSIVCFCVATAIAGPSLAAAATDPLLADQWALADPSAIGAQEAWTQSNGSGVVVAVLDTGVQISHPDLAGNIWTNSGEIAGNGIDDDANGVVDDVHGANAFDGSANIDDDNGHGTHVAGIIAARKGNGIGGSGLAPGAKIMPVKVLDANMAGTTDSLAAGIRYAVDNGARILNVSVNSDQPADALKSAVDYAAQKGAIIVASAGNNGRNIDLLPSYPASLTSAAVFSIAAETADGVLWNLSNTGLLSVDLAAPGEHIASTATGSGYQSRTGTSAAAPFVSASLALLSSARPDLSLATLREAITTTTKTSGVLAKLLGSGGRLDVGAAMHRVMGASWRTAPASTGISLRLRSKSSARPGTKVTLRWSATGAETVKTWRVSLDGRVVKTLPVTGARVSKRVARKGSHKWRVVGFDESGTKVVAAKRAFKVA